jgi:hypothetical protein
MLSEFIALDGFSRLCVASRGELRCTAIQLRTGGLCLFSPVQGLGETPVASLARLGNVEMLLAPNHYHNKGLEESAKAFPRALLCASEDAAPRLERITGLRFAGLERLASRLPGSMKIVSPRGLKTGEIWIFAQGSRDRAWLVVDAFCGPKADKKAIADTPALLGTFPRFGVADRALYLEWLEQQIEMDKPTIIVPCHGAIIRGPRLPAAIRRLIAAKL